MTWRQGRSFPIHIYDGDIPVATFHRAEDAARAVAAVNAVEAVEKLCDRAEARGRASLPEGMTMSGMEPLASLITPGQVRTALALRHLAVAPEGDSTDE